MIRLKEITIHCNYVSILNRFRDIITYFPKFKDVTWPWLRLHKGQFVIPILKHHMAKQCKKFEVSSINHSGDIYRPRSMGDNTIGSIRVCACVSVCLSHSSIASKRLNIGSRNERCTTLVFWCQRSRRNSNKITPYGGNKCRWGGLKLVTFDEKRTITRKRYKIDA